MNKKPLILLASAIMLASCGGSSVSESSDSPSASESESTSESTPESSSESSSEANHYLMDSEDIEEAGDLFYKNLSFTYKTTYIMGGTTSSIELSMELEEDGSFHQFNCSSAGWQETIYKANGDDTFTGYTYSTSESAWVVGLTYNKDNYESGCYGDDIGIMKAIIPLYISYFDSLTFDSESSSYKGTVNVDLGIEGVPASDLDVELAFYDKQLTAMNLVSHELIVDGTTYQSDSTCNMSFFDYGTTSIDYTVLEGAITRE